MLRGIRRVPSVPDDLQPRDTVFPRIYYGEYFDRSTGITEKGLDKLGVNALDQLNMSEEEFYTKMKEAYENQLMRLPFIKIAKPPVLLFFFLYLDRRGIKIEPYKLQRAKTFCYMEFGLIAAYVAWRKVGGTPTLPNNWDSSEWPIPDYMERMLELNEL
jgi:hypothetical protein